ncbi:hypothetical protein [Streptomyces sp. CC224B]|uniref:hypothetical protein n=1 Tax=Streptomyces sp. CC224B TaxID=3044571 RepID=UPI0024A8CC00|nr:hypothetical protein [Streptomyces sp. CC224B]
MREVDAGAVHGEQPGGDEAFKDLAAGGGEFGAVDGAAGVLGAVPGSHHAQQHGPGGRGLRGVEAPVHLLGGVRDGAANAADRLVGGEGEGLAAAPPPDLAQRVRQERQRAGFVADVGDEPRGERAFDHEPFGRRGPHDGLAQPGRRHGADEEGAVAQGVGERAVLGQPAVEVGAYGEDGAQPAAGVAGGEQVRDEAVPFGRVVAEGEDLLELVDDEERVAGAVAVAAGCEQRPVGAGGALAGREHADRGEAADPGPASVPVTAPVP